MNIVIENGHIIDPSQGIDGTGTVRIVDGRIHDIMLTGRERPAAGNRKKESTKNAATEMRAVNAAGLHIFPGFIDMHTHLREPGFEYKETIRTGTLAAVRGGFTTVCCMPNTNPVNDNSSVTDFIIRRAIQEGACTVLPIGAITKGQNGAELAEIGIMFAEGCVAFSDDGKSIMNSLVMRRALEYTKAYGVPIISHCEDVSLAEGGLMNEGVLSITLGLRGVPAAAEEIIVSRDIALAELTGGRLHIAHVSTAGSVRLVREAQKRGVKVTAETCPHYFCITEDAVTGYNTFAKVNPPLRTVRDVEAVKEGLKDGTIDVIATDHAPHHRDEKMREFNLAPPGISGLETALPLSLRLVDEGILTMSELVVKLTSNPARILSVNKGTLKIGSIAELVVVDTKKEYSVDGEQFISKGRNTPFEGWTVRGASVMTICKGVVHEW